MVPASLKSIVLANLLSIIIMDCTRKTIIAPAATSPLRLTHWPRSMALISDSAPALDSGESRTSTAMNPNDTSSSSREPGQSVNFSAPLSRRVHSSGEDGSPLSNSSNSSSSSRTSTERKEAMEKKLRLIMNELELENVTKKVLELLENGKRNLVFDDTIIQARALKEIRDRMTLDYDRVSDDNPGIQWLIMHNATTVQLVQMANKYYYWQFGQTAGAVAIFVFIVVGNTSILIRLKSCGGRRRRSNVNYFIVQLAIADLLVGIFSVTLDSFLRIQKVFSYGLFACRVSKYISVLFIYSSTNLLVALSIDRWEAVVKPLAFTRNRSRGYHLAAGAWLFACICSAPMVFFTEIKEIEGVPQCWIDLGQLGWQLYMVYLTSLLLVIPVLIIAICYIHIVYTIWSKGQLVVKQQQQEERQRRARGHQRRRQDEDEGEQRGLQLTEASNEVDEHQAGGDSLGQKSICQLQQQQRYLGRQTSCDLVNFGARRLQTTALVRDYSSGEEEDDDDDEETDDAYGPTNKSDSSSESSYYEEEDEEEDDNDGELPHHNAQVAIGVNGHQLVANTLDANHKAASHQSCNQKDKWANKRLGTARRHGNRSPTLARGRRIQHQQTYPSAGLFKLSSLNSQQHDGTATGMTKATAPTIKVSLKGTGGLDFDHHDDPKRQQLQHQRQPTATLKLLAKSSTSTSTIFIAAETSKRGPLVPDPGVTATSRNSGGYVTHQHGSGVIPKARIKTIKMTLVIVAAYILCWSPFCILNLCSIFGLIENNSITSHALMTLTQSLAHLNSAVNPIIYWVFSSKRTSTSAARANKAGNTKSSKSTTSKTAVDKSVESAGLAVGAKPGEKRISCASALRYCCGWLIGSPKTWRNFTADSRMFDNTGTSQASRQRLSSKIDLSSQAD